MYIAVELGVVNSFNTWHGMSYNLYIIHAVIYTRLLFCAGTKNVAKAVKKVAQGPVRSEGKTWFAQLSDKK